MTHGPGTPTGLRPRTEVHAVCRSCGAPITWLRTRSGKRMPADDPGRVLTENQLFDLKAHVSHFATCPQAAAHRKPRKDQTA